MAEIMYPNIVGAFQQAQQMGRENRLQDEALARRSQLGQLASQAYGTRGDERAGLVRQAIATDPAAGFELEDTLQGLEDAGQKRLIQSARFLMAAPERDREAIYQQIKPGLSEAFPGIQLPANYDQTVAETATALGSAYGPSSNFSDRYKVVGSSLIDLQNPTQAAFTAPDSPRYIEGDNGVFVATPEGLRRLDVTSQGAPVQAGAALVPDRDFAALGQQFGITPTSVARTPEHNREVGGVANSYHIGGNASDWAVPEAQKASFMERARSLGYEAIDEGDHIHVEPRSRDQLASSTGSGGFIPKGSARQAAADRRADEQLRLAQEAAARAGRAEERQVAANAITGKPPTEGERKAATLLSRLEFSLGQLTDATGQDASAASPNVGAEIARRLPFVGGDTAANFLTPAQRQQVESAQLDILDAALTLGTGAAYTREQLEGYRRSYFPQLGDSQENIDAKAARLQNVVNAARIAAGRAAPPQGGQSGGQPARPTTEAQYNALPSGALFVDPDDGRTYRKP